MSKQALADLDRLLEYGIVTFGLRRGNEYYDDLIAHFRNPTGAPLRYRAVDEIRTGYRRSIYRAHSVYYRVDVNDIEIVRVLGRENPATAF